MRCMPGVTLNKVRHGKNYNLKFNNKGQDSCELVIKDEGYRAGEYISNITERFEMKIGSSIVLIFKLANQEEFAYMMPKKYFDHSYLTWAHQMKNYKNTRKTQQFKVP